MASSCSLKKSHVAPPIIFQEGGEDIPLIYQAELTRESESLYVRMEQLTPSNSPKWRQFCQWTSRMGNTDSRGTLSECVSAAAEGCPFPYDEVKKATGFTEEEYNQFLEKAIDLSEKTNGVIGTVLSKTSVGSNHLCCTAGPGHFVVYVSNDREFSIDKAHAIAESSTLSLKTYIEAYQKILIAVGCSMELKSNFFSNRGIFRNPHWVFEGKYAGLSMILHGMTGAVAREFYPEHQWMVVRPVGSMQALLKRHLRYGEGHLVKMLKGGRVTEKEDETKRIDITQIEVDKKDREGRLNCIRVEALSRIFYS